MSADHAPNHDYHLVDPSPWPVVGSIAAFLLALGAVVYMHNDEFFSAFESWGLWVIVPGLLG